MHRFLYIALIISYMPVGLLGMHEDTKQLLPLCIQKKKNIDSQELERLTDIFLNFKPKPGYYCPFLGCNSNMQPYATTAGIYKHLLRYEHKLQKKDLLWIAVAKDGKKTIIKFCSLCNRCHEEDKHIPKIMKHLYKEAQRRK